ncbi:MAG: hypothetical protein R2815_07235 [Flavobacteriales bacterium]
MMITTFPFRSLPVIASILLGLCAHGQVAPLKAKAKIAPDPDGNEKRFIGTMFAASDRTLLVSRVEELGSGVFSYEKSAATLEVYDRAKLNLLRTQDPVMQFNGVPLFFETIVKLGEDPVMIGSRRDTVVGSTQLYWQKADANLTYPHRPFERLCIFDTRTYGDGQKIADGHGHRDVFHTSYSPDSSMVLLYSPAVRNVNGDTHRPMVLVDRNMRLVWKQTVEMPDGSSFSTVQVDHLGNAYMLDREGMAVKDMKKDTSSFRLVMRRVNEKGVTECDLGLGKERFLKTASLTGLRDSTLILAGMYTGMSGKEEPTMGDVLGRIPAGADKMEVINSATYSMDSDDAVPTKGQMRVLDVLPHGKDGYFVVREFHQETSAVDSKTSMSGLRWIHGPLVVSDLDAKGEERWTSTFRRLIYDKDPMVGEAFCLEYKGQLMLLLVDSEEQVEKRKSGEKKLTHMDLKSPFSTSVPFNADGTYKAKNILRTSGANDFIVGRELYRLGPSEYYATGSHKLSGSRMLPVRIDISTE